MDPITTAYNTVVAIRSVVVAIKLKETQCRTLCERAERAVTSLQHLAARTAGGKLEPGAHQQALVFAALLDKILHFMQRLNSKSFLHRFVTLHVLDAELDDLRAQLDYLVADLHLAIGMDARGLREQDARDRETDKKALDDQLLALAADQQRILVALGVRPSEYTEAMEAVKKTMLSPPPSSSSSTSDSEQKFAKAAYTALVRASGSETPTITVKEWTITSYEVEIGDVFARGGFGEVCLGTWRGLTTVAVKRLPGGLESKRKKKLFVKEVEVWFRLRHPNVMLLLGACWSAVQPFMIMPYMENGTLLSYAEKYPDQTLKLLHESAQGLHYLHTSNVVHGDLKAVNILVDGAGTPKLADFGFSTLKSSSLSTNTTSTIRTLSGHTLPGGTIRWCAPELLSGASSTFGSDIYAFGMVMYEVLSGGDLPFSTITSELVVMKQVLSGARPERPPGVADAVWEVVGWCWRQDTGERVSMHVVAGGLGRVMGRGVSSRPVSVVGGPVKGGGVQTMTPVEEGNSGGTGPLSLPPPYAEQTKRQQQQPPPPASPVVKFDSSPKKPSSKPPHHRHHHIPHSASFNNTPPSLAHTTGKQQQSASFDHLPMHTTPEHAHPNSNSNSKHDPHGASLINIPPSQPLPPHLSTSKQNLTPPNSAPAFISKPTIEMPTPTPPAPKPPHLPPSTSLNNTPPKLTFNTYPTDTKPPPAPPIPLGIAFPRSPTNGSGTTSWSLSPTAVTAPASNTRRASVGTTQLQPPIAPLGSVGNITSNSSSSTPQASVAHTNTSNANTNSISSNNANNSSKKKLPMVAAVPAIIESAHLEECEEGAHGADTADHPTDASTNPTNAKKPKQGGFTPDPSTPISRRQKRKKCCLCILLPLLILIAILVIVGVVGITQNKGFLFLGAGNSAVKKTNTTTTTTTGGSSGDTTAFDYTTSSQCAGMVSESVWDGTNLQSFPLLVAAPPSRVASRLLWGVASSCTHLISASTNSSSSNSVGVSVYEFPPTATDLVSPQAERVVQLIGLRVIAGTSSSGDQIVWSDDTVVHVTLTTSGADTARLPLNKHIVKLALPSNGKMERVFAHADDGTITEWSLTTKMQTRQYGPSNTRRADGVSPLASVITVDGGILAFAPDNTTMQWWSTGPGNGVLLKSISVPTGTAAPLPLTFSPDGATLFFLLGSTQFQRVDVGSGTFGKTYSGDWVQFGSTLAVTSDAQYGFGVGVYGSGGSGFTSFVVQIRLDTGAVQKLQLTRWATTTLPSPDAARVALTSDDKYVVFSLGANSGAVKMVTYDNAW